MVHRIRVRYGECDPQGIVFNANYLAFADIAITELYRDRLGSWNAIVEHGYDAVVAEAKLRFRAPARFDDEIDLKATVLDLGTTSTTIQIDIERDGETLVEVELRHVFVDRENWQKTPIPDFVREALAPIP